MTSKKQKIKIFHAALAGAGVMEHKREIVNSYGKDSTTELSIEQIDDAIDKVKQMSRSNESEADKWRKRVMAAIGAWLRNNNMREGAEYIKGIACRAAGRDDYNRITVPELRRIYAEWGRKNKAATMVDRTKAEEMEKHIIRN